MPRIEAHPTAPLMQLTMGAPPGAPTRSSVAGYAFFLSSARDAAIVSPSTSGSMSARRLT
jgi:hypothetical protein